MRGFRAAFVAAIIVIGSAGLGAPAASAADERSLRTQHFEVTWDADPASADAPPAADFDASGVPDAIERLAADLEAAHVALVDVLGYVAPPVDGRLQVYVSAAADGAVARVLPGDGHARGSFIEISPWRLAGSTATVAVHEYMHAIQNGYDYTEPDWIDEAHAAWAEEVVYDELNSNHALLRLSMSDPWSGLTDTSGQREYGGFLFFQFLSERFGGPGIVREVWEELAVPESVVAGPNADVRRALDAVLARRSATLQGTWAEYLEWQWDLRRFEEGAAYAEVVGRRALPSHNVRAESCRIDAEDVGPLGGDYLKVVPHERLRRTRDHTLSFKGAPAGAGFVRIKERGVAPRYERVLFDGSGAGHTTVSFGPRVKNLIVAVGNASTSGKPVRSAISMRADGVTRTAVSTPAGPARTQYGTNVWLSGTATCRNAPAPFADVAVYAVSSAGTVIHRVVTDQDGSWRLRVDPDENTTYSTELVDPLLFAAVSNEKTLDVSVFVEVVLSARRFRSGEAVAMSGTIYPAHPGAPVALELRRPDAHTWRTGATVETTTTGSYAGSFVPPAAGVWEVRARVLDTGDADHVPGTSVTEVLTVTD